MTETRVAVVDDDPAVRDLLEAVLAEGGHRSVAVLPGPNLHERLVATNPATIILDWRVDGGEGQAFDAIRHEPRLAGIPVLICTGDLESMRQHAPMLATLPNVVIVEKPFQVDVLLNVLERVVVTPSPAADSSPQPHAALADAMGRRGASAQARGVMEAFRATSTWACAELWLPDRGLLRCVSAAADAARRAFVEQSRATSLVPGFGLPGRVVISKRPAWIPDVREDRNFPRAAAARSAGVRAAAGVPITLRDAVIGMVGVYGTRPAPQDDDELERLMTMAAGLGPWLDAVRGSLLRPDAISTAARRLAAEATEMADVAAVDLLGPDGGLQRAAVSHRDPAMAEVAMRLEAFSPQAEGPVAVAVDRREAQRIGVSDATLRRWSRGPEHLLVLRALQLSSLVAAPLVHQDVVVGGITLASPDPRWHASNSADAALARVAASPAADELGRLVLGRRSRR